MKRNSRNGGQSEMKLPGRSEKTFCGTSITHILQSVWSNFTKILIKFFHTSLGQDPMVEKIHF